MWRDQELRWRDRAAVVSDPLREFSDFFGFSTDFRLFQIHFQPFHHDFHSRFKVVTTVITNRQRHTQIPITLIFWSALASMCVGVFRLSVIPSDCESSGLATAVLDPFGASGFCKERTMHLPAMGFGALIPGP